MKAPDLIAAIEACYNVENDSSAWLAGVHEAFSKVLERGFGTCAYRYDLLSAKMTVHEMVEKNCELDVLGMGRMLSLVDAEYIAKSWRTLPAGTASSVPGYDDQYVVKAFFQPVGVGDVLAINALDPQGVGIWVGGFLGKKTKMSQRALTPFQQLAAHIAAGFRVQQRLARAQSPTMAVVTPGGKMLHAEGDAIEARKALVAAACAIDKARGSLRRRDPEEAVSRWRGLVSARWSLVDQFESDGKRFLVAKANDAHVPEVPDLSARERQVVAHAALGHHNKLIAYELGLAQSTVRVLIVRAARKLKTKTREELVARYLELDARNAKSPVK